MEIKQKVTKEHIISGFELLDSNSFEIIVDRKVKLNAYLFSVFNFSEKFKKIQNMCFSF